MRPGSGFGAGPPLVSHHGVVREERPHGTVTSDRPRVAFLARDLVMGGAERAYLHYVNHLETLGPIAVLGRRDGALLDELRADIPLFDLSMRASPDARGLTGADRGHTGVDAPGGFTPASLLRLVNEGRRLRHVLRITDCRVVSSFLMRSHIIALLTKLVLDPELRVVINVHEHMSESATHLYPTQLDRALMRWITRNLFPHADSIVVVAESLRQDLIHSFGIPAGLVSVVHNPIDLARIRQSARETVTEREFAADGPVIIGVGRLVPLKGFDVLIRAFARLPASLGARLVVVGGGPERAALESLIAELDLGGRVRLIGMQANPWRFLARATVFALPSRTEAFPNAIGEALALGVPVVAAECSAGVREYLDGTRYGLLVPPGDPNALAAALERVLTDAHLRTDLAARGPTRMEALDLPAVVARYEAVLRRLVPVPPPARAP